MNVCVQSAIERALDKYRLKIGKALTALGRSISPEDPSAAVMEDEELEDANKEAVADANRVFYAECVRVRAIRSLFIL